MYPLYAFIQIYLALQESAKEESIKRNLSTVDECSKCDPASSLTCKPGTNDSRSVSADGLFDVDTKKEATKLAIGKRENRVDIIESAPQDQTSNDNLTCVEGAHQNNISAGQHRGMTSEEGQARLDGNEKNYTHVVQEENDTQRPLSQEQDNRILHDAILTNCLQQQKETEINLKKMNSEVSESYKKEKDLLRENHMLQDEIAKLRLQMGTPKTQNQEMEKKYFEDTANAKEKNDCLQKTIKLNDETLTKTVFEYNRQLNVPTAENTMLNSQLENERQSKERLKTEAESDHHYELSKQLIRHLQNAFQRLRDECLHFMDKIAMRNLKEKKEILSQQLSKAGSKFNSLDTELPHTRYAVRERTLVFEPVLKDRNQTQCQEEEIEHMYQREQGRVNTYIGKLESLKEKGSDLQSGNMLVRRQLDDAFNKSDNNENSGMNIEEQLQELKKVLQAECEKQERMVKERHKELVNKLNHLKGRMCQYENDKSEREVVGRQLQQELPDSIKKLPVSEASLEVRSHYRMRSEAETQDFKTLEHIRSQLQEARARHTEDARCSEKMEDHVQKLETENTDLKMTIKKPVGLIKQLHRNLSGTSLSEDEKEQLKYYKKLTESLQYNLNQRKKKNDGLEKEFTRLKTPFQNTRMLHDNQNGELNFLGGLEPSQFEMDIQMNRLKQKEQAASQENVDPLNDHDDASISDMEVRIQRRESELPKVKTSRDSFKIELEECKRLYLEELKLRTSLENKLNKTNDRLAEMRTQLLMKAPRNTLLSTDRRRPVQLPPCIGRLNDWFLPRGNLAPREQLVILTSTPQTSNNGTLTN
ncbi:ankyrin repeat domain-containing protein 26 isoform X4 [Rhinolophus ferrumequinum]|uniref:ankyrin repeat domain-containing protein 26 isoform X4 n=1 Tax=Rhinolophus ferrumequinum TaxID=59479 RepID=UPI00140F8819|nr:ankyrin repeat domain-containing protein 26 isoform X4 [Rhinolophus ferrumequinum]